MIEIVKACLNDAETLQKVSMSAFAEDTAKYGIPPSGIDEIANHRAWIERFDYYKIMVDDEIVGGILVSTSDASCELEALFIMPEYQHQGIGTQAMHFIEQAYPDAKKWSLCTAYLNYDVQRFYERLGYVRVGQTEPGLFPTVPDKDFYVVLYEKKV